MRRRSHSRTKAKEGVTAPAWMATYSDLVTLLLAFFVMLTAMANFEDLQKVEAVLTSIRDALGVRGERSDVLLTHTELNFTEETRREEALAPTELRLREAMAEYVSDDVMAIIEADSKLRIVLEDNVFFHPGSYELHPSAYALVSDIAGAMKEEPVRITVEGYTDATGDEQSDWRLSALRAVTVVNALRERGPIEGERLRALSGGPFHPGGSNGATAAWNRRVEIVLEADDVAGTAAADALLHWRD